jgi:hypothetical protein
MSTDNSQKNDFSSWSIKDPAQRDVRHYEPNQWDEEYGQLGDAFNEHRIVSHLAQMLKSDDPEQVRLAKEIIQEKPGSVKALRAHTEKQVQALKNQVAAPKKRGDWSDATKMVRALLNSGGK